MYQLRTKDGRHNHKLLDATLPDKPSNTRLVDNLEKHGLVKLVASKDDSRIKKIYHTPEAEKVQEQSMEVANQTLNEALEGVTNGQVEIAKEVLQKDYENLS